MVESLFINNPYYHLSVPIIIPYSNGSIVHAWPFQRVRLVHSHFFGYTDYTQTSTRQWSERKKWGYCYYVRMIVENICEQKFHRRILPQICKRQINIIEYLLICTLWICFQFGTSKFRCGETGSGKSHWNIRTRQKIVARTRTGLCSSIRSWATRWVVCIFEIISSCIDWARIWCRWWILWR